MRAGWRALRGRRRVQFLAFRLTSVADATIIGALAPVASCSGRRWFGERMERRDLLFVGASLAGVVIRRDRIRRLPASACGAICSRGQRLHWTAYWLFSKRARASVGALEYMATVMPVAAILMTAFAAVSGEGLAPPQTGWTGPGYGS